MCEVSLVFANQTTRIFKKKQANCVDFFVFANEVTSSMFLAKKLTSSILKIYLLLIRFSQIPSRCRCHTKRCVLLLCFLSERARTHTQRCTCCLRIDELFHLRHSLTAMTKLTQFLYEVDNLCISQLQ